MTIVLPIPGKVGALESELRADTQGEVRLTLEKHLQQCFQWLQKHIQNSERAAKLS